MFFAFSVDNYNLIVNNKDKNMNKLLKTVATITIGVLFVTSSFAQNKEKLVSGKWKMISETRNGEEIEPEHENLILTLKKKNLFRKNNEFTITAAYEETHSGTWEISEDGSTLLLHDSTSRDDKELELVELDKKHLGLGSYDGPNTAIYLTPMKGKAADLNHKEHLLAKKWTIFDSEQLENIGMMMEFQPNKTFVMIPYGYKVPVATGKWKLSDDNETLIIDKQEDGEHLELKIVEMHRHELSLKDPETGVVNHFHDEMLVSKDKREGIFENAQKKIQEKEAASE